MAITGSTRLARTDPGLGRGPAQRTLAVCPSTRPGILTVTSSTGQETAGQVAFHKMFPFVTKCGVDDLRELLLAWKRHVLFRG